MLATVIGVVASTLSLFIWLPQFIKIVKNRNDEVFLKGISTGTQSMALTNSVLWLIYGWLVADFWIAFPSVFSIPLTLGTLYFLVLRKPAAKALEASAVRITTALSAIQARTMKAKDKLMSARVNISGNVTRSSHIFISQISSAAKAHTLEVQPSAATSEIPIVDIKVGYTDEISEDRASGTLDI